MRGSQFRGGPAIATDFHQGGLFVGEGDFSFLVEADVLEVGDESGGRLVSAGSSLFSLRSTTGVEGDLLHVIGPRLHEYPLRARITEPEIMHQRARP